MEEKTWGRDSGEYLLKRMFVVGLHRSIVGLHLGSELVSRGGATVLKVGVQIFFDPHFLASGGQNIAYIAKSVIV